MNKFNTLLLSVSLVLSAFAARSADFVVSGTETSAVQRAVDAARAAGGGRVVVPAGEWRSGSIRLYSHVELHLAEGARLVGGTSPDDYFDFPEEICSVAPEGSRKVFVYGWDAEDIAITGKGVIDGRGPEFFDRTKMVSWGNFWAKPSHPRPRMVEFVRCRKVRLEEATFKDSPGWTMLIRQCEDIAVRAIRVEADQRIINSDGIDFDSCRRVRVGDSFFRTGDDCLILRAMRATGDEHAVCEDVVVSNCVLNSACQCVRIGCPSDDVIRKALFRDIRAGGNNGIFFDYPVRYLRPDDEGYIDVSDLVFDGWKGEFTGSAIQIVVESAVRARSIRDLAFRNFDVTSARQLRFVGNADAVLEGITLENIRAKVSAAQPCQIVSTRPLEFRNCVFNDRKVEDGERVVPGAPRTPLKRVGGSWESAKPKAGR